MSSEAKSREAICALGAKLAARGLCPGTSGNISVKIADGWLMTPTNSSLGELDPAQLSKLDSNGKHVGGDPPTKEALLHRSVYDVRPKDGAIVHLHSTHAVAISCLDPSCHHNAETPHQAGIGAHRPRFVSRRRDLRRELRRTVSRP